MKWTEFLQFKGDADGIARLIFTALVGVLLVMYSMVFEVEYGNKLVELFMYPWWRILMVFLVISSAIWCPRVGILVALAVFFYLGDMETLLTPFASTAK